MKTTRQIIFHKHYFIEFYSTQVRKVQEKFLDHVTGSDGIFEIRIEVGSNIFRIFCCFDKGNLVVLFNAFQKKTQKTPKNEIELAAKLKKEYFHQKK